MNDSKDVVVIDVDRALSIGTESLRRALADLKDKHSLLFSIKGSERSITHLLACSTDRHFEELTHDMAHPQYRWSIDCEYNRMFAEPKHLPYDVLITKIEQIKAQQSKAENQRMERLSEEVH
ncbi:MAG: hypothetical protein K2X77_16695 [Candidatus Obscuribacterales bacterium]|jgi:hypothetical protein|nr:hypothetical protein [Candidatus Obscuribacterales bacterium]